MALGYVDVGESRNPGIRYADAFEARGPGIQPRYIKLPPAIVSAGFDRLTVTPTSGSEPFSVAYVIFYNDTYVEKGREASKEEEIQ
jgi:hypothetical protein